MVNNITYNYSYFSNAKKIAYIIKNYSSIINHSFFFEDFEDLNRVALLVLKFIDNTNSSIIHNKNMLFNEFFIRYNGELFNVLRSFSANINLKSYKITKISE